MFSRIILSLLCCGFLSAAVTVPAHRIVISTDKSDNTAALELKLHLEKITGRYIPLLVRHQQRPGAFHFHVGCAPAADRQTAFKPEEARWKVSGDAVWFYGDKSSGTINAVYDFLESELGVRWPWGDEIACRHLDPLIIRQQQGIWVPELQIRNIRTYSGNMKLPKNIWARRMRQGSHNPPKYGHAFTGYWNRFGKSHPEYFAMRKDGVRAPVTLKGSLNAAAYQGNAGNAIAMCVSNDRLVQQVVADWDKQSEFINLCENDALPEDSCHCPECRALDVIPPGAAGSEWQNYYADRYIHFANRVLEAARHYRPDVKVCMYGYNATELAPAREKLHPNIVIGIVPTVFSMDNIRQYVGSWKKAGLNRFFYRPNRHVYYSLPQLPCGSEKHFFEIWQYLYRSGAMGFDYDSGGKDRGPHDWLTDYIIDKAMQDPSKSFEYWEKHYMASFGAAADDVRNYFRYWREQIWEKRLCPDLKKITEEGKWFNFARGLCWSLGKYYKPEDFDRTRAILQQALSRNLTPEDRKRVEALRLSQEHARLFYLAVVRKQDQDSINLWKFRKKHGMRPQQGSEQYWGDITGVGRVMNFKDFKTPYIQTPLLWDFKLDPLNAGLKENWPGQTVDKANGWLDRMPTNGTWENPSRRYGAPGEATRKLAAEYDGIAWYAIRLDVPADWKNRKEIHLYFGAVDESCKVFVNGRFAGEHQFIKADDWTTPFTIPVTKQIDWTKKEQSILVRVEDKAGAGGIWKRVWLLSR